MHGNSLFKYYQHASTVFRLRCQLHSVIYDQSACEAFVFTETAAQQRHDSDVESELEVKKASFARAT